MNQPPIIGTTGHLVWRLSMKWRAAVDRAVSPLGLTHAQYSFLASLFGIQRLGHRPTQRELADQSGLEPLYVSKLARALEAAGLIERQRDPVDTRAVRLSLTDAGHEVIGAAMTVVAALVDQLLAPLGGRGSPRSEAFAAELRVLLGVPSDPPREKS